ncbi:plasmid partition protein ParG [Undibacterium sp. RTI2.2]|uniref:plasmid partition protein ParG n=1 Tax=unclassified Undibacterium TaxID=2630295 RepID=UPI002B2299C5|nr:plasmid partition protein ParG [Undibacterium sp. RTI2.2]MEB0115497.1 plasmid partition protein ParG [Undibacterium sp. RTI2.2]
MSKKISFGTRQNLPTPDQWVESKQVVVVEAEPTKRLTLDLPKSLHGRFKAACALSGESMLEVILKHLEEKYPSG